MRNLLNFLLKYNNFIVFLVLEGIALYWLTNGNSYHNSSMVKGMQGITRGIEQRINNSRSYFNLRETNSKLAVENNELRNKIEKFSKHEDLKFVSVTDTIFRQQYQYTPAKVISNSVNKPEELFYTR